MSDENNAHNDLPNEEQESFEKTESKYWKPSDEKLNQILKNHKKWVESDGEDGKRANLAGANLRLAKLTGANLQEAVLVGANLQEANLFTANLQGADLAGANLQEATLAIANLQGANLYKANLQGAKLTGANLQEANLDRAKLQEANLYNAKLQEANLYKANLQRAALDKANLQGDNLVRANLQDANLKEANLQEAKLRRAYLQETNLRGANLKAAYLARANLQGAYLARVNLQNAHMKKSDMRSTTLDDVKGLSTANLQYANFEGATGLLGNEFAHADVTGAKLPDDIKDFKALEIVKETSQNARKIFFAMLLGCVYSWLTIGTTTDVNLLTNTASSPLPIIQTEIPIAWFYIVAPLILICIYFYFHLYLIKLWEALSGLPAIFPDGKRLDEIAYPWLLNGLVRRHFKLLKKNRPFIAHVQEWITIFLAWWVVPITMIAFWLRYIPRHDWLGTSFHILLLIISVAFAIIFLRMCALKLQGIKKHSLSLDRFLLDRRFYQGVGVILVGILFSMLSYGAIEGVRINKNINSTNFKEMVPLTFQIIGYDVFANFIEKSVSEKPDRYWEISNSELHNYVKGANLRGANLNNADMRYSFLAKADLRGSHLQKAKLDGAKLQKADLRWAELQKATLTRANLKGADLRWVKLQNANLEIANLQEANLNYANLQQAILLNSNLQQADLVNSNLQQAELRGANLQKARLWNANLQEVDLKDTNLQEADLMYANLVGSINLTIEQLSKVKTLYQANLDPNLLKQVKECCPYLLEKPKDDEGKEDKSE
jgi:uncharacterized protein YjbI with pentapeptide repeats